MASGEAGDHNLIPTWAPVARKAAMGAAGALVAAQGLGVRHLVGVPVVHLAAAVATGSILLGVRLYRRPRGRWLLAGRLEPWLLIAGGVAVLGATQAGTDLMWGSGTGSWLLGLAAAGAYPPLIVGLLRLVRSRLPDRDADILVEAGLVATLFGLSVWALLSTTSPGGVPAWVVLLSVALPALDLVLLTVTVRLLLLGERIFVYRALGLAVAYLLAAHLTATLSAGTGWASAPGLGRLLLMGSFAFFALAALHPSMRRLSDPLPSDPPAFSPGHLVLTQIGALAAPAVIALYGFRQEAIPDAVAVAVSVLSVVLAAYLGSLLWQRSSIEHRAHHDQLTGLPNRTLFTDRLSRALAHARRNDHPVAVIFVDLDRFKEVNDGFGHPAGDELLRQVARRLEGSVREEDTVARLGGDEFALLMPHTSGVEGAVRVAERILSTLTTPVTIAEQQIGVSASLGISMYPEDGSDPQILIAGADAAMYAAKERGRSTYEIFSAALRSAAHERLALESALHRALDREELILHYQPKVDLHHGRIIGAEALVRWNHPEQGLLFPGHFVPLAEESGQVVALGEFVIAAACEQLERWDSQGLGDLCVSVNVSARQLRHGVVDFVASALRHTGIDPRRLELELTESAALESLDITVEELNELRRMGVRCSIDDFGTGYCGLSYLSRLPIDGLKIDRSFIAAMSETTTSIVSAIVALGQSLDLTVTGEGVETEEQLAVLARLGCDDFQGYLFSKPVPAEDFARLVVDHVPGGRGRLPIRVPAVERVAG